MDIEGSFNNTMTWHTLGCTDKRWSGGAESNIRRLWLVLGRPRGLILRRTTDALKSSTVISKKMRTTDSIAKRLIKKMARDRMSPRYLFDKKYKVSLSLMEEWKEGRAHLSGDGDHWFADGSKNR